MSLIEPILQELEQEATVTRRVLERVPDDRMSFRPHSKSMSLGQLALHIATTPSGVSSMASLDGLDEPPKFQQEEASSRQQVLDALEASLSTARSLLGAMDDARLGGTWTIKRNGEVVMALPRLALLRGILLNHWYHHRGQLTVYLRLLDVPLPSVYGPSADENPLD
jgi:uncharacterized damage-inducible protein DinB